MTTTDPQVRKDAAHMWFALGAAGAIAAGIAFAVWQNGQEDRRVRVSAYAGRSIEPDRTATYLILGATVVAVVLIALAWRHTVQRANQAIAQTPNEDELDHLFAGDPLVPVQAGHGGMSHSVLVAGARQRGYTLTSQGTDGSMVFETRPGPEGQGP